LGGLVIVLEGDGVAGSRQSIAIEEAVRDSGVGEEVKQQRPPLINHSEAARHTDFFSLSVLVDLIGMS